MLTLIMLAHNEFLVTMVDEDIYERGDRESSEEVLLSCGAYEDAIQTAFEEMENNSHNRAYFGVFGEFTYSEDTSDDGEGAAQAVAV